MASAPAPSVVGGLGVGDRLQFTTERGPGAQTTWNRGTLNAMQSVNYIALRPLSPTPAWLSFGAHWRQAGAVQRGLVQDPNIFCILHLKNQEKVDEAGG